MFAHSIYITEYAVSGPSIYNWGSTWQTQTVLGCRVLAQTAVGTQQNQLVSSHVPCCLLLQCYNVFFMSPLLYHIHCWAPGVLWKESGVLVDVSGLYPDLKPSCPYSLLFWPLLWCPWKYILCCAGADITAWWYMLYRAMKYESTVLSAWFCRENNGMKM